MKHRIIVLLVLTMIIAISGFLNAEPRTYRFPFDDSTEGWSSISVIGDPATSDLSFDVTSKPSDVKVGKGALETHYRVEEKKMAGIIRPVDGLAGKGLRVWLKTDTPATLVLGLIERDGSGYQYVVQTPLNKWTFVEVPFISFNLSDDSKDENGRLDPDQVSMILVADAGGFLPGAGIERTLWVDEYEITSELNVPKPKPYKTLLDTGVQTASGARATSGITYLPGKFGQGILADSAGEMSVVRINWPDVESNRLQWDQGTIEMWISPQFNMDRVKDFTGLVAMHDEPFNEGFKGSLLVFYTKSRQIAFVLNAQMQNLAYTMPLNWKSGEWHHIAVTWGEHGMCMYQDGMLVNRNQNKGGPAILSGDMVVGNQAWTVMSDRYSNTIIDELRLSKRQMTDDEIAADAKSVSPLKPDQDTLALEHFDGTPLPPIRITRGTQLFNSQKIGKPVKLQITVPSLNSSNSRLSYTVLSPSGIVISTGFISTGSKQNSNTNAFNTSINLKPFKIPGFYRLTFKLMSGDKVINKGADWFRVDTSPSTAAKSDLLFGASACYAEFTDGEDFFRYANNTGVKSLRASFEWAEIEPGEGKFVWGKYDRIVEWADKHNIELIPTFIWEKPQPSWAGRGVADQGSSEERYPPEDMAKWSEFVYQVVNRYKGSIHWWIPANEPNLSRYWYPKPDAKAYVNLLKVTRDAVLKADPNAKILGCSAAGIDLGFLEDCFREGALNYCDAVGFHPYICPSDPGSQFPINVLDPGSKVGTFSDGLRLVKELITRYGGKQNLWLDEAGQPYRNDFMTQNWGVSEETAAEYMMKIYLASKASGYVDRVLWFSFLGGNYGSFALLKPDGSPSLPAIAYAAGVEKLAGMKYAGQGNRGEGIKSFLFKNGNKSIEVVLSNTGEKQIALSRNEKASDIYSFPKTDANKSLLLNLTSQPVYLEKAESN